MAQPFNRSVSADLQDQLDFLLGLGDYEFSQSHEPSSPEELTSAFIKFRDYHAEQHWAQSMVRNYRNMVSKAIGAPSESWEGK